MYFSNNDFLIHLREIKSKGLIALKSEYETEGVRREEFQALADICKSLSIPLSLKIGGCEAITDLYDCRKYNVDYIIAPMIESIYAVKKFSRAINRVFPDPACKNNFLINIETISAFKNIDGILDEVNKSKYLNGVVFGRVDFTSSLNKGSSGIDSDVVREAVITVAIKCRERNIDFVVGGGISAKSVGFLTKLSEINLTRFETRKCIFESSVLHNTEVDSILRQALQVELLWLNAKRKYYQEISSENNDRLDILSRRHIDRIEDS